MIYTAAHADHLKADAGKPWRPRNATKSKAFRKFRASFRSKEISALWAECETSPQKFIATS